MPHGTKDTLLDMGDAGLEVEPVSPYVDRLAQIIFSAQEEIDPIERRTWDELTPFEHEFYRYPARALLMERDAIVKALEQTEIC